MCCLPLSSCRLYSVCNKKDKGRNALTAHISPSNKLQHSPLRDSSAPLTPRPPNASTAYSSPHRCPHLSPTSYHMDIRMLRTYTAVHEGSVYSCRISTRHIPVLTRKFHVFTGGKTNPLFNTASEYCTSPAYSVIVILNS